MSAKDGRVGASVGLDEVKIWRVSEKKGCFAGTLWQYLVILVRSLSPSDFFLHHADYSLAGERASGVRHFHVPRCHGIAPLRPL